MKCGQLNSGNLAQAYRAAMESAGGAEVDIQVLAPHLKATGSSCGACPALLTLAKKAFEAEAQEAPQAQPEKSPPPPARQDEPMETTRDVVRESIFEIIPDLRRFIPQGG